MDNQMNSLPSGHCEPRIKVRRKRWRSKPEQIQILESKFISGLIKPTIEETQRIKIQLEKYGKVSDRSIHTWFQNRRHKAQKPTMFNSAEKRETLKFVADSILDKSLGKTQQKLKPTVLSDAQHRAKSFAANNMTRSLAETTLSSFYRHKALFIQDKSILNKNSNSDVPDSIQTIGEPSSSMLSVNENHEQQQDQPEIEESNANQWESMQARVSSGVAVEMPNQGGTIVPVDRSVNMVSEAKPNGNHSPFAEYVKTQQNFASSLQLRGTVHEESAFRGERSTSVYIDGIQHTVPKCVINIGPVFGEGDFLGHSSGKVLFVNEEGFTFQGLESGATYHLEPKK